MPPQLVGLGFSIVGMVLGSLCARPFSRPTTTASTERDITAPAPRGWTLARILFLVYVALVAYASLYPLSGWRDVGLSPFAFLGEPWPRYFTRFDIVANVAGYLPFGFLAIATLHPRLRGLAAFAVSVAGASVLSLVLEAAQSYLPARGSRHRRRAMQPRWPRSARRSACISRPS